MVIFHSYVNVYQRVWLKTPGVSTVFVSCFALVTTWSGSFWIDHRIVMIVPEVNAEDYPDL
jgi:hypothetical protein